MKNKDTFYQISCDHCQEDSEDANGMSWWMDEDYTEELAAENGFIEKEEGEKHYCQSCAKKLGIEEDKDEEE